MKKYYLGISVIIMMLSQLSFAQPNTHVNRFAWPAPITGSPAFTNYVVGCNAIAPYVQDRGTGDDTYISVSVIQTNGGINYLSLEQRNMGGFISQQSYWDFRTNDAFRVNDVTWASSAQAKAIYGKDDIFVFCGSKTQFGSTTKYGTLFMSDGNLSAGPVQPIQDKDPSEFHSIAEIPGNGYVVCGEKFGLSYLSGILLYLDYNFNIISAHECKNVVFQKVIYDPNKNRLILLGMKNSLMDILVCSIQPFSNTIQTSFEMHTPLSSSFSVGQFFSNHYDMDLILLSNDKIALAATGTKDPVSPFFAYAGILFTSDLNGNGANSSVFNLGVNQNADFAYVKDIETFDEKTFYILMHHYGKGIATPAVDIEGSVIVEAIPGGRWNGLKITSLGKGIPPKPSDLYRTELNKMFKRQNCNHLVVGGNDNQYWATDSRVQFGEVEIPLNLGALHSDIEHRVANVNYRWAESLVTRIAHNFSNLSMNFTLLNPIVDLRSLGVDVIYQGNLIPFCPKSKSLLMQTSGGINEETANSNIQGTSFYKIYPDKIELSEDVYQSYQIYDVVGHLLYKSDVTTNRIDCKDLRTGVYIIQLIKKTGESQTIKFVKP